MSRRLEHAAQRAIGALLVALGTAMIAGWALREPALVGFFPGYRMVLATAAGLALGGAALLGGARLRVAVGAALLALGFAAMAQHAFGVALGIDLAEWHHWLPSTNPQPGRMSAPTAAGFAAVGAAFVLVHAGRWRIARALLAVAAAGAAAALAGALLDAGTHFERYLFAQVSLPTAAGMLALAAAGLLALRAAPGYEPLWESAGTRIQATLALLVAGGTLAAALGGFTLMQRYAERVLRAHLAEDLETRVALVERELAARRLAGAALAARPELARLLREAATRPAAQIDLQRLAAAMLEFEFIALAVHDRSGALVAHVGDLPRAALVHFALPGGYALAWRSGIELESRIAIADLGEPLGELRLRQPLTEMMRPSHTDALVGYCRAEGTLLRCLPSPGGLVRGETRALADVTPQMKAALAGEKGVLRGPDFRGADVIAAYGPLPALGLVTVKRVYTRDLFGALRGQLLGLAVLLACLAALMIAALRLQIAPLVARLARSEEQLRLALQGSRLAVWEANAVEDRIWLSPEWGTLRGGPARAEERTLAELLSLLHPEDAGRAHRHVLAALKGEAARYDIEFRVRTFDDAWIWVRSRGEVVERDRHGRAVRLVGTNAPITERKERELALLREATHDATHDALTGLANRRLFDDRLAQAMARTRRAGGAFALLLLDMDRFKPVNDTHGHAAGDALLRAFAARLATCVRSSDTVARLGGDEFALVLESVADVADARRVCGKIVERMREPFEWQGVELRVSASIGVALYRAGSDEPPAALCARADRALYNAKLSGRDRWSLADLPERGQVLI